MNCEQVEEGLSAYLDNMLAPEERRAIASHLQSCPHCMTLLAELRQNDILLARLPRVSPSPALHTRIFSTPEVSELVEMCNDRFAIASELTRPLRPEQPWQPQLVSLAGGRVPQAPALERPVTPAARPGSSAPSAPPVPPHKRGWFTPLRMAVAAALIVALGTAGLLSLSLRQQTTSGANTSGAITPPAAGPETGQAIPLAAGTRLVFLRNGALWSTLVDGSSHQPERLTPTGVTVASAWAVSPAMPGHAAGDMLAYIDAQHGTIHTIRSDGQQDTPVPQVLLKAGKITWESPAGEAILNSLAWSPDDSTLAFVGDPAGNGLTNLYLYSSATGKVQKVSPGLAGSVSHPVWSPDGTRLAFEVAHDGVVSILDYNLQDRGTLNLSNIAAAQGDSANGILTLAWSPASDGAAVTWSLGSIGHVSSVWVHRVGTGGTLYPQELVSGDYLQALYSPHGDHGAGSWLLVATVAGQAGDIWRIDLTPGAGLIPLSRGKQVSFACWSPDGSTVFYLDGQSNGIGNGHLVNVATGADRLFASNVAINPAPAWSANSQQLAYSAGAQIKIVNTLNGSQVTQPRLQGRTSVLTWSPAVPDQLIIALDGATPGIYLDDTQHNTSLQLDRQGSSGPIQWTEIP